MEIAVIDRSDRFNREFISYIQKKFNGVHITLLQKVEDLMEQKQAFDFAVIDQIAYINIAENKVYKKYIKQILCVCYKGESMRVSNIDHVEVVQEDDLQDVTTLKIRNWISENNENEAMEAASHKTVGVYMFIILIFMILGSAIDRTGKYGDIMLFVLATGSSMINTYYWFKKESNVKSKDVVFALFLNFIIFVIFFIKDILAFL